MLLAVAAALLLATASCGGRDQLASGATAPAAGEAQLLVQVLKDIDRFYIEPVSIRRVAAAGAAQLERLDKEVTVREVVGGGGSLALSYGGRTLTVYPAPDAADSAGWGGVVKNAIEDARQASARLAAMPREKIEQAVSDGMTRTLDRYSRYASADLAAVQRTARRGWGGIGVTIDGAKDIFRVTAVAPHSPAERAGIRPEDQIVAIDGVTTRGCLHRDIVDRLRGPVGSPVALQVVAAGMAQSRELTLKRAAVSEPTVTASHNGDVAVIRVHTFNHTTTKQVAESLAEAQRQTGGRLAGVVLDLRSNPGGVLEEAVRLAELFLRSGPVVSTIGRHPASRQYFSASGRSLVPDVPLAVLINGGSASASEIVAAALQDSGRAAVIGSSSYGKGSVQTVLRLPDNGELTLTWARLIAPSGYQLSRHGVIPTICTADLPDDANALAIGLQRAAAPTPPRALLDDAGWAQLRRSCPAARTRPAVDLTLAQRVLGDAKLYAAALHALPAAADRTQTAAAAVRALP